MKKAKTLSLLTVPVLAVGMLAACGPKDSGTSTNTASKGDGKTLVVWEDKDKVPGLQPAVDSFEKKYGVKVTVKEIQMTDQLKQLRLDGPAGTGPDVITLPHDQIGGAVTEGLISELKVDDSVLSKYTDVSVAAEKYQGKLYGLPKAVETAVFIYNKKLLQNPLSTMDEVYNYAKANTKDGQYGFLAPWDNLYFAEGILGGYGGYIFDQKDGNYDATKLGLNNDGAVKGADYIQKWYKEGLFPAGIIGEKGGAQLDGLFTSGKAASVIAGPWAFGPYKDAGIDYGVAPLPTLPNGEHIKSFIGVKGWHVTSFSKNKDLANQFVQWVTNEENAKIRFEKTKEIPPVKAFENDPEFTQDQGAKAVAEQAKYSVPMPNNPEMAEVWKPVGDALQLVVTGKADSKTALDGAVKQINTNIQTNYKK
ncbi:extracellular solute-binding protein [Ectobacillus polymachus]|uniref:extracellular solute-binding protein n=1 Tax=Ectobacillus polymachus TaxID=1508806 RepID=UPI003A8419B8